MCIERAHAEVDIRMTARNLGGAVAAATVEHDNPFRPAQTMLRTREVGFLVQCQQQWRDLVQHHGVVIVGASAAYRWARRSPIAASENWSAASCRAFAAACARSTG